MYIYTYIHTFIHRYNFYIVFVFNSDPSLSLRGSTINTTLGESFNLYCVVRYSAKLGYHRVNFYMNDDIIVTFIQDDDKCSFSVYNMRYNSTCGIGTKKTRVLKRTYIINFGKIMSRDGGFYFCQLMNITSNKIALKIPGEFQLKP